MAGDTLQSPATNTPSNGTERECYAKAQRIRRNTPLHKIARTIPERIRNRNLQEAQQSRQSRPIQPTFTDRRIREVCSVMIRRIAYGMAGIIEIVAAFYIIITAVK